MVLPILIYVVFKFNMVFFIYNFIFTLCFSIYCITKICFVLKILKLICKIKYMYKQYLNAIEGVLVYNLCDARFLYVVNNNFNTLFVGFKSHIPYIFRNLLVLKHF